jgi:hypothetical protein
MTVILKLKIAQLLKKIEIFKSFIGENIKLQNFMPHKHSVY